MSTRSFVPWSFQALALLLPPVAALAPKAVVALLSVAALPALIGAWHGGWRPGPDRILAAVVAAWAVWALVSCTWTFDPVDAGIMWLRDGALLVLALLLLDVARTVAPAQRACIGRFLAIGVIAGAMVIGLALASDHALTRLVADASDTGDSRLNRGATTVVLCLPLALLACRRAGRISRIALAGAAAAAVAATPSGTALLALLATGATAAVVAARRSLARTMVGVAAVAGIAVMPGLVAPMTRAADMLAPPLPESAQHRLYIWRYTAARIAERPVRGWGFNSAEAMPNFGTEPFYADQSKVIPLHPHNAALQIRLDLGVPGIGIAMALLAALAQRTCGSHTVVAAARVATLVAALTIACLAYGIWQEQWVATLVAVGVLAQLADGFGEKETAREAASP